MARLLSYDDRGSQGLHLRRSWSGVQAFGVCGRQTQGLWLRKVAFADACAVLEVALEAAIALAVAAEASAAINVPADATTALVAREAARRRIEVLAEARHTANLAESFPDVLLEVKMNAAIDLETGKDADRLVVIPQDAEGGLDQEPDAKADLQIRNDAALAIEIEECDKK